MNKMNYFALILVFGISLTAAYPQERFPFSAQKNVGRQRFPFQQQQFNPDLSTTTPAPSSSATVGTTQSPEYLGCVQNCPRTSEYNPICGSDGINYSNNGHLSCATRCGRSVVATRSGTCRPL